MGGSSGGGTTTTVQKSDPWAGQQAYLAGDFNSGQKYLDDQGQVQSRVVEGLFPKAYSLLNQPGPSYFPGSTIAGFNPNQIASQGQIAGLAGSQPGIDAANKQLTDTLGGAFMGMNGQVGDYVRSQVQPAVDSRFGLAGRSFSPAHAGTLGREITRGLTPFMDAERNRQISAAGMAPGLDQARYYGAQQLGNVGLQQQQQSQDQINADIARHNYTENLDANKLAQYAGLVTGNYGTSGLTTQSGGSRGKGSPLGDIAGLVGAGAQAYSAFGGCHPSFKTDKRPAEAVLDKVRDLDVERWRYKPEMAAGSDDHLGPYADQFRAAFGVGDGVVIHPADALGVCLKAIQELAAKVERLENGR